MGGDLQNLVTVDKIEIAEAQIKEIEENLKKINEDVMAVKKLCDNLKDTSGDGIEIISEFKELLEALKEHKNEIKNSFDRQTKAIGDIQALLEVLKSSRHYQDEELHQVFKDTIEDLETFRVKKSAPVLPFVKTIDEKLARRAQITVKGK